LAITDKVNQQMSRCDHSSDRILKSFCAVALMYRNLSSGLQSDETPQMLMLLGCIPDAVQIGLDRFHIHMKLSFNRT
jgi:hypothetical protein